MRPPPRHRPPSTTFPIFGEKPLLYNLKDSRSHTNNKSNQYPNCPPLCSGPLLPNFLVQFNSCYVELINIVRQDINMLQAFIGMIFSELGIDHGDKVPGFLGLIYDLNKIREHPCNREVFIISPETLNFTKQVGHPHLRSIVYRPQAMLLGIPPRIFRSPLLCDGIQNMPASISELVYRGNREGVINEQFKPFYNLFSLVKKSTNLLLPRIYSHWNLISNAKRFISFASDSVINLPICRLTLPFAYLATRLRKYCFLLALTSSSVGGNGGKIALKAVLTNDNIFIEYAPKYSYFQQEGTQIGMGIPTQDTSLPKHFDRKDTPFFSRKTSRKNQFDTTTRHAVTCASELKNSLSTGGPPAPVSLAVFLRLGFPLATIPAFSTPGAMHACPTRKGKDALACSCSQVLNPRSFSTLRSGDAPAISATGERQ
ncbi:MAG: hypothetical protein HQL74_13195 [Magnetococcales bacterium]|nr:hypothetical protein [Magnetococcales bacterium]